MSERVNTPISTAELNRRWAAVRAAMEREGIDVLLMQNNSATMGGYVRYLTDVPAGGFPVSIVFPRDDAMTMVAHGPLGGDRTVPVEGDGFLRGVRRTLTTPSFASAPYSREYDPRLVSRALARYARATIGLVGTFQMSFAMVDVVKRELPDARYVEASELVDRVKMLKSPEEIALIRDTAALQDAAMQAAFDAIEPGMRDSDVVAIAEHFSQRRGSEYGTYMCGSAPPGEPAMIRPRHQQRRVIREGDVVSLLVENAGPSGLFTELGRTCVLGAAPQQLLEELEFTLEAQRFCLGLLRPGTPAREVWEAYNAFLREHDRPEETRIHCHGQGYDLVERPLIRFDEPFTIEPHTNLTCHPTYVRNGAFSWICDNFLIGADGGFEPLHAFPQRIVEL